MKIFNFSVLLPPLGTQRLSILLGLKDYQYISIIWDREVCAINGQRTNITQLLDIQAALPGGCYGSQLSSDGEYGGEHCAYYIFIRNT